ncbi:hypothetical protein U1Q18_009844 [Sarracenia purpurea var. burkii]
MRTSFGSFDGHDCSSSDGASRSGLGSIVFEDCRNQIRDANEVDGPDQAQLALDPAPSPVFVISGRDPAGGLVLPGQTLG